MSERETDASLQQLLLLMHSALQVLVQAELLFCCWVCGTRGDRATADYYCK